MTLLSGIRNAKNSDLSRKTYDRIKLLFGQQSSDIIAASVLVSNTLLAVGKEQQAQEIRSQRIEHFGHSIKFGLTWTCVDGNLTVKCLS